ncbi:MAG: HAMP domain-containing protein [Acidobacteria bacterium]|nr:HAMP domain-containing protein [Acidobacteriota bacterium]
MQSRLLRIALVGSASAALAVASGLVALRVALGPDDGAARARIERRIRDEFRVIEVSLRETGRSLAARAELIQAAADDEGSARTLFEAIGTRLSTARADDRAVTIYGGGTQPLAWSGRPSELPADRIRGPEALFVAPGPLGLRLVYVLPVTLENRRIATLAIERVFSASPGMRAALPGSYLFAGVPVPVLLRARYEGAGEASLSGSFLVTGSTGEALLEARMPPGELQQEFDTWRSAVWSGGMAILAVTLLAIAAPLFAFWSHARTRRGYLGAALGLLAVAIGSWVLLRAALPPAWSARFLLASLLLVAFVLVGGDAIERGRLTRVWRGWGRPLAPWKAAVPVLSSLVVGTLFIFYQSFLRQMLANSRIDVLHFSLHPYDPDRLAVAFGFVVLHAAIIWTAALLLRWSWLLQPPGSSPPRRAIWLLTAWSAPLAILIGTASSMRWPVAVLPTLGVAVVVIVAATVAPRLLPRYRHASQAARLGARLVALLLPMIAFYPVMQHFALIAKRDLVETQFARQVMSQREDLKLRLRRSLPQIDRIGVLPELVSAPGVAPGLPVPTDQAFRVWSQTELATFRLTSAIELYARDGSLVSRFALNLPEITPAAQKWTEPSCEWDSFEEVAPIGSEERRLLHAGRGICDGPPGGARSALGGIVVHVMLDYNALPFISSQSPYYELFRGDQPPPEGVSGREVEFAVYGWSLTPIYSSSAAAWPLVDRVFERIYASRDPFWATVERDGRVYDVYFMSDRGGIYALGYPTLVPIGHLLNVAELIVLVAVTYVVLSRAWWLLALLTGTRAMSAAGLLREVRASFYRKLFLAFVGVAVVPVIFLALLARAYIAGQLRGDIESSAQRTASVARRVIEDYASLQSRGEAAGSTLDDDVLVGLSRVVDQDVNVFEGSRLVATSERDLFASGLLPTRTPANVYGAIILNHAPSFLGDEEIGGLTYLVAAASVRTGGQNAILTIPLASRQQETEREKDDVNRRILLAALIFIVIGALSGYWMAERIADPVNRLTRATRRIAKGDLDARIAATSSDELRRLVDAFNSMAAELQRQRARLERTHRLEAWAEMARQVAHDIKNPLTPIQLSAEHLQRVHADRGKPLSPVLEGCLSSILLQVRLLRQIASEFSSFGSSPTPRPAPTSLAEVVRDVVRPYEAGLAQRIALDVRLPPDLPLVNIDRTLLARALTNIIENALHAMPGGGTLSISGDDGNLVRLDISDTGVGMDPEALARIFEPYFSTKATGTGLGLTIAKRNIEMIGGTIEVQSARGRGTTVTLMMPRA